jgi:hypothetical protein
MTAGHLGRPIRSLERITWMLKMLHFIKGRYEGDCVEKATSRIGISKMMVSEWQDWRNRKNCSETC